MSEHTVTVLTDGREEKRLYAPAGALFLQLLKAILWSAVMERAAAGAAGSGSRTGTPRFPCLQTETRSPRRNFGTASVWPVYTG